MRTCNQGCYGILHAWPRTRRTYGYRKRLKCTGFFIVSTFLMSVYATRRISKPKWSSKNTLFLHFKIFKRFTVIHPDSSLAGYAGTFPLKLSCTYQISAISVTAKPTQTMWCLLVWTPFTRKWTVRQHPSRITIAFTLGRPLGAVYVSIKAGRLLLITEVEVKKLLMNLSETVESIW